MQYGSKYILICNFNIHHTTSIQHLNNKIDQYSKLVSTQENSYSKSTWIPLNVRDSDIIYLIIFMDSHVCVCAVSCLW